MNIQHDGDSRGENINNMNIYPGGTTRYDPSRSPMMVEPLKSDFVPRPELDQVIGSLISSEQGSVGITSKHALRGAGGYGKTTIAQAVCHNEQIRAKFKDGILWVRLSESPPDARPQLLGLLYLLTGIKLDSTDINAIKTELDQVLQDRSVLLVVDDAWRSEHLTPFLLNCTLLITTRNRETLPRGIEPFTVDAMREGESVKLLGADLEADLAADPSLPDQLKALAKRLGYWPLLLQLVNKTLNKRLKKGGESLAKALNYIDKALKHEGLIAFDDPEDLIQRNRAVEATLKVSFNELNPQERDRFNLLAVFPEDTLIPFPALEKLWGIDDYYVDKFCERLESLSLVRQIDLKTYTILIHDVIRQYLIETMESSQYQQAQQRFLDAYGVSDWRNLPADERYLRDHLALAHHVIEAGQLDKLNAILQNLRYLAKKTHLKGRIAVENDFKAAGKHADEQTRVLGRLYINHAHFFTEKSTEGDILTNLTLRARQVELLKPFTVDLPTLFEAIWDLPDSSDPALVRRVVAGHTKTVTAGMFSPDGYTVLSASWDNTLRLWDRETGAVIRVYEGHTNRVRACAFSPDGNYILSASDDRTLRLWDRETGTVIRVYQGHTNAVTACAWSRNDRYILSASADKTLLLWDRKTRAALRVYEGHTNAVTACAWSRNDRYILSASDDRTLRLWDRKTGAVIRIYDAHTDAVTACAFSHDDRFILSASADKTLRLWDRETGAVTRVYEGHTGAVTACAFSPDERFILSASLDNTARIWETETGRCVAVFHAFGFLVGCAWSHQGNLIALAGASGLYVLRFNAEVIA